MELSEYVLEPLRKDEEFILYRGQHRNQVDAPSVLLLAPALNTPRAGKPQEDGARILVEG